jgi:hypothetical protein
MTTPSIVIPSTSVVLLDSRKYNGSIIVQLGSLKTVGSLITVRDIGGVISNTRPIILSTVSGLRFSDGKSSFDLVMPYDSVTFQPKTALIYEIMNSSSYPPPLPNSYTPSLDASYLITVSTVAAYTNIESIERVSTLIHLQSTIIYGPTVLSNSLTVSSPMTYIQRTNAFHTDVGHLEARSFSTDILSADTIETNTINIFSSFLTVGGSTFIRGPLVLCNTFTTQPDASVLQIGNLNTRIISTSILSGNIVIDNNLVLPQICTLSTIAKELTTSIFITNNMNVTNNLSAGFIVPLRAFVRFGQISSLSTNIQYTRNLSTNSMIYDKYNISSFFINDSGNGNSLPLWASNSSIYYDKTVISFLGKELPTLQSTIIGIGSLKYLSSLNLDLVGFSTGQIFSRTLSTQFLDTPILIQPIVSTNFISVNSLYVSNLNIPSALLSSLSTHSIRATRIQGLVNNVLQISSGTTFTRLASLHNLSTQTINASTLTGSLVRSINTSNAFMSTQILDSEILSISSLNTANLLANIYNLSSLFFNLIQNNDTQANKIDTQSLFSFYNQTSTLLTNNVLFNDDSAYGRFYFDSGLFYVNNKIIISLDNAISQITSTSVGLGQTHLSSIKWLPSGLSTNQLRANSVLISSLYALNAHYDTLYSRNLNTVNLQFNSLVEPFLRLSILGANETRFSSLRASLIATQNLSLDRTSINGNNFVFDNLSTNSSFFSTVSINNLVLSSASSRLANVSSLLVQRFSPSNTILHVLSVNDYRANSFLTRNTNAITTDSGLIVASSIYAPIIGANNLLLRNSVYNSRFFTSSLNSDISSINASISSSKINIINTQSVRTSTFYLTDASETILSFIPSTTKLYLNGDFLPFNDVETRTLISTVNGLGTMNYISSYKNNFIGGLSTVTTFANQVDSDEINATSQNILNLSASTLISLSSIINIIRAQNINILNRITARQTNSALQITSDVYTRNLSSCKIETFSSFVNVLNNRSAIYNTYLSSVNIQISSLSSINLVASSIDQQFLITSSLAASNLSTSILYAGQLCTSSLNTNILSINNAEGSTGLFSSLQIEALQINYLENSTINSLNMGLRLIGAQNGYYNQLNMNSVSSHILSGSSTLANSIYMEQGSGTILTIPKADIKTIQTNVLTSQFLSTIFLSTHLLSTSLVQLSTLYDNQIIAQSVSTAQPFVSTFSFLGNILSYSYPYLYLNNVDVTTPIDVRALDASTTRVNANIISTMILESHVLETHNLCVYSTILLSTSTTMKSVQANNLSIPNFGTFFPTLLSIFSSYNNVRANTLLADQISTNILHYDNLKYTNIIISSVRISTLATHSLKVNEPLKISSLSSSNILTAVEGTYNLLYNSFPVAVSSLTSTATTVTTNGRVYVAGGLSIPSFWGAGSLGSTTLVTSLDGQVWTPSAYNELDQGVYRVIWTGSQFIAVGKGRATMASSSNGTTWSTVLTSSIYTSFNDIVQGRQGFVAVGQNGIIRSTDGQSWISSFTTLSSLRSVTTNGSVYVAGGLGLATSKDGRSWSSYTGSTLTRQINDIEYNGSLFVAVGQDGIATSVDGLSWINQISSIRPKQVSWTGTEWLAAASSIYISRDGLVWSEQSTKSILISTFLYTGLSTIVTAPQGTKYVKIQMWGAGGAGGTSTFQPYYLAKTKMWLDASYRQSIILSTNTSTVQIWSDRSSNANKASTLSSVLPPAYYSSSVAFTSSTALTASIFQTQSPFTFSLIGKIYSSTTQLFNNLQVSSSYLGWQASYTQKQISTHSTIIFSLVNTLSTVTWRINGQEDSSKQGSFSNLSSIVFGQGQFDINEILFFNSNMPTRTLQQIEGYYANKWSTLYLLPQNHSYLSMANIHTGGGGAYIEGVFPLETGLGSTFGIFTGQGGKYNVSTQSLGAYYSNGLYFSTSGGLSYDSSDSSFAPNNFSSLGLWLDGKDPLGNGTLPQNNSPVSVWIDKSTQARSAYAVDGQVSYYSTNYLYFSSSKYQINYQNFNSTAYTIFTVQLLEANKGTYQTVLSGGDSQPSLFSGVLSNAITTLTGDDIGANVPLIDGTTLRITDSLVVNNILQPFVDGSAQNQKFGLTGSFSTLFIGGYSPSLSKYIGFTQNYIVIDRGLLFSSIFVENNKSTTVVVYDANNNPSTVLSYQMPFDAITVYDTTGQTTNLPIDLSASTFVSLYDINNAGSVAALTSTVNLTEDMPTKIDVYNPSAPLSTLTLQNSYIDCLSLYDPSLSGPYSSFTIYNPLIEVTNWQGRISEVLCYDVALSVGQRQTVEGYLATKWNLQANLPPNHPYRYTSVYSGAGLGGAGGGGASSGILLPNGQFLIAAGGGGGGQGTEWDGGGGGLDIGQRGSYTDSCNVYGYSIYSGLSNQPGGGGGSNQGGQGARSSNVIGEDGLQGRGGSGGIDNLHVDLPGGGGGGGFWGGGGGALEQSAGGGSSKWKDVAGFVPSFSYSMPCQGQGSGQGMGGYATYQGSNGLVVFTFLSNIIPIEYNSIASLKYSQNVGLGNLDIQSGLFFATTSSVIQSFTTNIIFNNTLYVDQSTNKTGINTAPLADLSVNGSLTKTAGSFVIHDPTRKDYRIRHSFTESPTAGDTLYRWLFSTVDKRFDYKLPEWFSDLNTNPQVWISPRSFYQQGRGYVKDNVLSIQTTDDGLFEVLCVATRKDSDATHYFKSPEYV